MKSIKNLSRQLGLVMRFWNLFDSPQRANFARTIINIAVILVVVVVHDRLDIVAFLQMHRSQSTAVDGFLVLPVLSKRKSLHSVVS